MQMRTGQNKRENQTARAFVCDDAGGRRFVAAAAALARFDEAFCLFKGSNNVKRFLKDPSGIGAAFALKGGGCWVGGWAGGWTGNDISAHAALKKRAALFAAVTRDSLAKHSITISTCN